MSKEATEFPRYMSHLHTHQFIRATVDALVEQKVLSKGDDGVVKLAEGVNLGGKEGFFFTSITTEQRHVEEIMQVYNAVSHKLDESAFVCDGDIEARLEELIHSMSIPLGEALYKKNAEAAAGQARVKLRAEAGHGRTHQEALCAGVYRLCNDALFNSSIELVGNLHRYMNATNKGALRNAGTPLYKAASEAVEKVCAPGASTAAGVRSTGGGGGGAGASAVASAYRAAERRADGHGHVAPEGKGVDEECPGMRGRPD